GPAAEPPARRRDRLSRRLPVPEESGEHLEEDLRLRVAAHRAGDGAERAVGAGDERGGEGVRGPPSGAVLGGVARLQREADAAVVEVDPGTRLEQEAAGTGGVRLDEGDAEAVAVHGAEVRGVAVRGGHRQV